MFCEECLSCKHMDRKRKTQFALDCTGGNGIEVWKSLSRNDRIKQMSKGNGAEPSWYFKKLFRHSVTPSLGGADMEWEIGFTIKLSCVLQADDAAVENIRYSADVKHSNH